MATFGGSFPFRPIFASHYASPTSIRFASRVERRTRKLIQHSAIKLIFSTNLPWLVYITQPLLPNVKTRTASECDPTLLNNILGEAFDGDLSSICFSTHGPITLQTLENIALVWQGGGHLQQNQKTCNSENMQYLFSDPTNRSSLCFTMFLQSNKQHGHSKLLRRNQRRASLTPRAPYILQVLPANEIQIAYILYS